jgi:hypothetical protein
MSINRITAIAATERPAPVSAETQAAIRQAGAEVVSATPAFDQLTQPAAPARFPWINSLSRELESASAERPTFPAAPALGDHLNQSA